MNPKRIISLVPSQTELLFDLGLADELVGLTKFCIYPANEIKNKTIVGGTKTLHPERIHALRPDLIIANKEENNREQIEDLQRQYAVHVTNVVTLPDALAMIRDIGVLTGKGPQAETIVRQLESTLYHNDEPHQSPRLRVAYFIWRGPYLVAANDTFINAMLDIAGFRNAFADRTRYPEITPDELQRAQPELIFLSSEPYPFTEKHRAELREICPSARVFLVDGEMFSWYGSRLLRASDYFRNLQEEIARHDS